MNKPRKNIPTLLAIFILIFGIASGIILLNSKQIFRLGAKEDTGPKYVTVSNIDDNHFSISFITPDPTRSYIKVGGDKYFLTESQIIRNNEKSSTHYFDVNGLEPDKDYYYYINTNGSDYFTDNIKNVKTGSKISTNPDSKIIYGKVYSKSGEEQAGAIVYVQVGNGSLLSSITGENGDFIITLSKARENDMSTYINIDPDKTTIQVVIQYGELTSSVTSYLQSSQPLPPIILGNNQDIRNAQTLPNYFDLPTSGVQGTSTKFNNYPFLIKDMFIEK